MMANTKAMAAADFSQVSVQVLEKDSLSFGVTACASARLRLSETPNAQDNFWEIIIGDKNNRESRIEKQVFFSV